MNSSLLKLSVISLWIASCATSECYWDNACGNDHSVRSGVNQSYCCPKSDGQDVILCVNDERCIVEHLSEETHCVNVNVNLRVSSVSTYGRCVKLYEESDCEGKSTTIEGWIQPGRPYSVGKVTSLGPCLWAESPLLDQQLTKWYRQRTDGPFLQPVKNLVRTKRAKQTEEKPKKRRRPKVLDDPSFGTEKLPSIKTLLLANDIMGPPVLRPLEWKPYENSKRRQTKKVKASNKPLPKSPVVFIKRHPIVVEGANVKNLDRIESMSAIITEEHLSSGSKTNAKTSKFNKALAAISDPDNVKRYQAGHVLANNLGGLGGDTRNIFPVWDKVNNGAMKQVEEAVALAVSKASKNGVRYNINLKYASDADGVPYEIHWWYCDVDKPFTEGKRGSIYNGPEEHITGPGYKGPWVEALLCDHMIRSWKV